MQLNPDKILVIKLRDIGDIVLSTPVLKVLKHNYPKAQLHYLLKNEYSQFAPLLPGINKVYSYDKKSFTSFFSLIAALRKEKYTLVINLHATYRSALISLLSGAKFRLVHNHSGKNYFTSEPLGIKEEVKNIIERDLDTLTPLTLDIPEALKTTELIKLPFEEKKFTLKTIGLGVGAKRKTKMWAKKNWVALGTRLAAEGFDIAVVCSKNEKTYAEEIALGVGNKAKVYADLDFSKLASFLSRLRIFIGNDSGVRHMAAALGVNTVTLFGPEDIKEWHPYKEEAGHSYVFHRMSCINCALEICDKPQHYCMDAITVEEVYSKVKQLVKA